MELKTYIEILKKNIVIIVLVTLLGAAIGFYFSKSTQTGYQFDQTFFLSSQGTTSNDTAQNSYYTLEKARDFTDTAVAIIQSPDFASNLNSGGEISVRKQAPQIVKITAVATDAKSAKTLMADIVGVFNAKIQNLSSFAPFQLEPIGPVPAPHIAALSPKIVIAFGLAAGFVASLVVISFKTYFRL